MILEGIRALDSWGEYGGRQVRRFDDVTLSAFLAHELTDIIPQQYDRLFPELDAKDHIPLGVNVSPGAMSWAYDAMDKRGRAEFLGANATSMPRADISRKRLTFPIRTMILSYGWTVEEIEAARFAGVPLDRGKADACRRGIAELENSVLLLGDASHGLPGFLTNPATPRIAVPNGDWLGAGTTPDEILQDMNTVCDQLWTLSGRTHRPNTIVMPLLQYRHVMTTRITTINETIASFFLRTNGWVRELMALPDLATVGPSSTASFLAYQKDPSILSGVIPLAFQQMEAQVHGFEAVVPCREKIGGAVWFYPFAGTFGDGI